ncbi:hypothetical protein SAMD00023353_4300400 [Rosellinia necatrix]|uniref:Uncharacterized protein n=1 Tax=Rosellinia necatrix TaxID=77044 RepID=A0A1W2TNQ0_ROSNE|nr:hypothetical protein SAMD00023353_4300400 [Rosellinia necatrix]
MSFEQKGSASAANFEIDPRDLAYQRQRGMIRLLNSVRVGLTVLALLSGITILGTSANAVMVYNNTHVAAGFHLPLWPDEFDLRPAVALVVGSSIIIVANLVSLVFTKVRMLQNQALVHTSVAFLAPSVAFVAALVGMTFFYAVNASTTADTLQSWSCQWRYASMRVEPYFGALCRQSEAALYLSVALVPVEFLVLAVAGVQMTLERKAGGAFAPAAQKPSSPALS